MNELARHGDNKPDHTQQSSIAEMAMARDQGSIALPAPLILQDETVMHGLC
jgi:hypothetical protein